MGNDKEIRVAIYIDGSNLYHKLKDLKIEKTTEFYQVLPKELLKP